MRKFMLLLISVCLTVSLCACGTQNSPQKAETQETLSRENLVDEYSDKIEKLVIKLAGATESFDVKGIYSIIDEIESCAASIPEDIAPEVLDGFRDENGKNILDNCKYYRELMEKSCIHNTDLAVPQVIITVKFEGGYLVNDHGSFAAYNVMFSDPDAALEAFEQYRNYVSKYVKISGDVDGTPNRNSRFTFEDQEGGQALVLLNDMDKKYQFLQVRVPRFEE